MSNTLLTNDIITRECLRVAHEKAVFLGSIDRQYDEQFNKEGGKQGQSLRIRMPNQYTRRQGSRVMDVQDMTETSQTLTVATQDGVDLKFNSAERALSIEDFSKRHIEPAMASLISGVESDVLVDCIKKTYNLVGTAGTVVGAANDITALGNARAKLNQYLAPKDSNRNIQMDSITMASVSNAVKAWFEPKLNAEAFKEGMVGRSAMADFYENERTWTLTNGADVAGEVDESASTNFVQGTTTFHFDGMGNATVIPAGAVFTIESVYAVHPETKQAYAHLQQFTVTAAATADSGGDVDVTFSPAIYTTGAKQNVTSANAFTAAGWNNLDITFFGSASTAYRQNLMYHKEFATFVTADLPIMTTGDCKRRQQDGISLRVWTASDIRNDEELTRIDILYGWKVLRPEWACRISN